MGVMGCVQDPPGSGTGITCGHGATPSTTSPRSPTRIRGAPTNGVGHQEEGKGHRCGPRLKRRRLARSPSLSSSCRADTAPTAPQGTTWSLGTPTFSTRPTWLSASSSKQGQGLNHGMGGGTLRGLRWGARTEIFRRREGYQASKAKRTKARNKMGTGITSGHGATPSTTSPRSPTRIRGAPTNGVGHQEGKGVPLPATAQTPSTRTAPEPALRMISPGRDSKVLPNGFFEPYGFSSMSCSSTGSLMRSSPPPGGVRGSDPYQLFSP